MQKIEIAIDLGSTTSIYIKNIGLVLKEPSLVAVETASGRVLGVGKNVSDVVSKNADSVKLIKPIKSGIVDDINYCAVMLKHFLSKLVSCDIKYAVISATFAVPLYLSKTERENIAAMAYDAGISNVDFICGVHAIPLAFDLSLNQGKSYFVCHIGGDYTDIAVVNRDGVVMGHTLILGGNNIDKRISEYVSKSYGMKISMRQARKIKEDIGSLFNGDISSKEVTGVKEADGSPMVNVIMAEDVKTASEEVYITILSEIKKLFEKVSSDIVADIDEVGILLSGGSTQILGLTELLEQELQIKANTCEYPSNAIINGLGLYISQEIRRK